VFSRPALRAVAVPFLASRLLVLGALVATRDLLDGLEVVGRPVSLLGWDAAWYRDIAAAGYGGNPDEALRFFPLFPVVARALATLPGVDAGTAVIVTANVAALFALSALYVLALEVRGDSALARRAVWWMALAPPSFVLVMGYSEGLFLVVTTLALLALRRGRWWWAAAAAFAAGLTRPVGVLLTVPALVEGIRARDRRAAVVAVAPFAGMLAYLAAVAGRGDGFWYPLRAQEDPARRGAWVDPVRGVAHAVREAVSGDHPTVLLHLAAIAGLIALVVVLVRRGPVSFAAYAGVTLLVALCSRNYDSLERYALAAAPFALALADVTGGEERVRLTAVLAGGGMVALSMLAFAGVIVP